jgi:hypothetical protein
MAAQKKKKKRREKQRARSMALGQATSARSHRSKSQHSVRLFQHM